MLIGIYQIIYRLHNKGLSIWFVCVLAHVWVKGNEVDVLAKQSLNICDIFETQTICIVKYCGSTPNQYIRFKMC